MPLTDSRRLCPDAAPLTDSRRLCPDAAPPELVELVARAMEEAYFKYGFHHIRMAATAITALAPAFDAARREGIEMAAKCVEHRHTDWGMLGQNEIAAAIRALGEKS